MTELHIKLLEDLGAEFERVARSHERQPRRRMPWLRWRTPLLVGLLSLVLASAALAALDVLPVGTKLPAENVPGPAEPKYTSQRTVVATGESPGGNWRMTVTQSNQGRCIGLWLLDMPGGTNGTDICGNPESFDAASVGGGNSLPNTTLVFGPAPDEAAKVRVTAPGFSRTVPTYDGPSDIAGNSYLIEIPRKGLRNALVTWLDEDGRAPLPGLYVPSTIVYDNGPAEPQRPH
jgi:hypothetical protein